MRAVVQRVVNAKVEVAGEVTGSCGKGMLILLGVEKGDTDKDFEFILKKTLGLRIFDDENGVMNRSIVDISGEALIVSQFTLLGDASHGNRPSYILAEDPAIAKPTYERFLDAFRAAGVKTGCGVFGAEMMVSLINDGPVTIILDSRRKLKESAV